MRYAAALKPGTRLICVDAGRTTLLTKGETYILDHTTRTYFYVLMKEGVVTGGWLHDRFVVAPDDGADYQPPDDIDLQVEVRP